MGLNEIYNSLCCDRKDKIKKFFKLISSILLPLFEYFYFPKSGTYLMMFC